MSDRSPDPDLAHGVPPVAVSFTSTRDNRTGSWKDIRPVFRDRVAPCNQACPVGIDVEGCMNLVREGRVGEAIDLLLRENPLPATTGRVCYHSCERTCNRTGFDQPVAIHAVERMLGDLALETPPGIAAPRRKSERVAVIGSGPAGLSCAWHLARFGYGVTVYEAEPRPGGVLRYGIPEYRLPKSILSSEIERIAALGVEFRCGVRIGRDLPFDEIEEYDAVFVATGVHRSRPLEIEGGHLDGVMPGLRFLREVNRGESPAIGRRVVVVGGGNTAIDCARTALRLGSDVVVLYRRGRAEMPAHPEEVEHAVCEGVRFEFLAAPDAFLAGASDRPGAPIDGVAASFGEDSGPSPDGPVAAVRCRRTSLGEPDASGRRRPLPVEGSDFFLGADTVLLALGEDADVDFAPKIFDRAAGVVRVNPVGATGRAAVFAGGDLLDEPHTVAYALGSGKRAAIGIDHYLARLRGEVAEDPVLGPLRFGPRGNLSATRWRGDDPIRRASPVNEVVGAEAIHTQHFTHAERHRDRYRPVDVTRHDFREAVRGLTREEALAEAGRCLNCGVCNSCGVCLIFCPDVAISKGPDGTLVIDDDHCKGCGICAAECPRGAITMTREGL
jgi:NADPH-dependent glutamate synthase beta subunit-like oxidoreductase